MAPPKVKMPTLRGPALKGPALSEQAKQNARFLAMAAGGGFLVFVVLGFVLTARAPEANGFLIALLLGPAAGVTAARLRYGWPKLVTREGTPLVSERWRPFLWFPITGLCAAVVYVALGVFLTPVLPPGIVPYVSLAVGVIGSGALAFFLVGFPNLPRMAREQWRRVPVATRPWLAFPIGALLTLAYYFLLGLALTNAGLPIPLETQPLIALPLSLVLAGASAYLLVGFPKPQRPVREYVPDVPGRARPLAFTVTLLLAGVPLTFLVGLALMRMPALPLQALVPVATLLGYALAVGVAVLAWGTPRRWRRFPDYVPGLPDGARAALFLPAFAACALAGAVIAAVAGIDMFIGVLAGSALGVLAGLFASGAMRKLREARASRGTLLPDLPDKVKPLVLFPTWILVGLLVFTVLAYALPDFLLYHFGTAVAVGLVTAVLVVEQATVREWLDGKRAERARREALRARRKAALERPAEKKA